MDKITYVKNKFRKEQWEKLIADCQNSGLKVDDWCAKNNVRRNSYYYWLRKMRKDACEAILPAIPNQETQIDFAKVELPVQQTQTMASVILHLPSATLEIYDGTNKQTIEAVLMALKNIC